MTDLDKANIRMWAWAGISAQTLEIDGKVVPMKFDVCLVASLELAEMIIEGVLPDWMANTSVPTAPAEAPRA